MALRRLRVVRIILISAALPEAWELWDSVRIALDVFGNAIYRIEIADIVPANEPAFLFYALYRFFYYWDYFDPSFM